MPSDCQDTHRRRWWHRWAQSRSSPTRALPPCFSRRSWTSGICKAINRPAPHATHTEHAHVCTQTLRVGWAGSGFGEWGVQGWDLHFSVRFSCPSMRRLGVRATSAASVPCAVPTSCAGTGLTPPTPAPGLGSPCPHLHRDSAHPSLTCIWFAFASGLTSAPRASCPYSHRACTPNRPANGNARLPCMRIVRRGRGGQPGSHFVGLREDRPFGAADAFARQQTGPGSAMLVRDGIAYLQRCA